MKRATVTRIEPDAWVAGRLTFREVEQRRAKPPRWVIWLPVALLLIATIELAAGVAIFYSIATGEIH